MRKQVTEYTCDVCGCEVDESVVTPKFITFEKRHTIQLIPDNTSNVCIYCFIKAVNKLDSRPKAANQ